VDYDHASENLRLALPLMARYRIPPTPENFIVWYHYVAGTSQPVRDAVDSVIRDAGTFDERTCRELHRRFYVQDDETVQQRFTELRQLVAAVLKQITEAGGDLTSYGDTLAEFVADLEGDLPPEQLGAKLRRVLDETRNMEVRGRHFHAEFQAAASDVEQLRRDLEHAREEALTDELTRLPNRRAFERVIDELLDEVRTAKLTACLMFADIDNFKGFNDTHGHLVGDKVLQYVAATIKRSIKGKDMAARVGGEEFAIIVRETTAAGAMAVADEIRKAVASGDLKRRDTGELLGKVTVSLGVTQCFAGDSRDSLIRRADAALYRAKSRGRDRVELES